MRKFILGRKPEKTEIEKVDKVGWDKEKMAAKNKEMGGSVM